MEWMVCSEMGLTRYLIEYSIGSASMFEAEYTHSRNLKSADSYGAIQPHVLAHVLAHKVLYLGVIWRPCYILKVTTTC